MDKKGLAPRELEQLRRITSEFTPLSELILNNKTHKNPIRYEMEGGVGWGYPLYKSPELGIQRVFMPKGTIFQVHTHGVTEWVFTTSGTYKLIDCPQAGKKVSFGELVVFAPGEEHGGEILEDTWILCWTIPCDMEGYPDVV